MASPVEHLQTPGGVIYSPASEHSKELSRWEMKPLDNGSVTQAMIDGAKAAGMHHGRFDNPEFPKAMYRAVQTPNGIKMEREADGRMASVTAHSDVEQRNLESRGYHTSEPAAMQAIQDYNDKVLAPAAAERAYQDRRMSAKAQAEAEAIDNSTARHLGEVPREPIKRRGRPAKVVTEA